jgi:hypothetical protein
MQPASMPCAEAVTGACPEHNNLPAPALLDCQQQKTSSVALAPYLLPQA